MSYVRSSVTKISVDLLLPLLLLAIPVAVLRSLHDFDRAEGFRGCRRYSVRHVDLFVLPISGSH